MSWKQWLAANQMNIDFGESSIDLMRRAYVAGLRTAHDLLYNAEPQDFHYIRLEVEALMQESK
jgi:hypothetical protein